MIIPRCFIHCNEWSVMMTGVTSDLSDKYALYIYLHCTNGSYPMLMNKPVNVFYKWWILAFLARKWKIKTIPGIYHVFPWGTLNLLDKWYSSWKLRKKWRGNSVTSQNLMEFLLWLLSLIYTPHSVQSTSSIKGCPDSVKMLWNQDFLFDDTFFFMYDFRFLIF